MCNIVVALTQYQQLFHVLSMISYEFALLAITGVNCLSWKIKLKDADKILIDSGATAGR